MAALNTDWLSWNADSFPDLLFLPLKFLIASFTVALYYTTQRWQNYIIIAQKLAAVCSHASSSIVCTSL